MSENVVRIPPQTYIHILNNNTNLTRLLTGPLIYIRKEHEQVIEGPTKMINMGPRSFCKIADPVERNEKGEVVKCGFSEDDDEDQIKVKHGGVEIRTSEMYPEPFALYPGERLVGKVEKQQTVLQNTGLRLRALCEFEGRKIGEEWQIQGPCTYIPRVQEEIVKSVKSEVIKPNSALKLKAVRKTKDVNGVERQIGEQWLIREQGAYLVRVDEEIVGQEQGFIITEKNCLHLKALKDFKDIYGEERKSGDEWLVKNNMTQVHIKDIYEEVVGMEQAFTLSNREYCVIMNPVVEGKTQWGKKILVTGERTFFLDPGEIFESEIEQAKVLGDDETILLKANKEFKDDEGTIRTAGEIWLIKGPREYIPPCEVEMLEIRRAIPLDENEGIYVRNNETGEVVSQKGSTYVLKASESLWEKELDQEIESLLYKQISEEEKKQIKKMQDAINQMNKNNQNMNNQNLFGQPKNQWQPQQQYQQNQVILPPQSQQIQYQQQFNVPQQQQLFTQQQQQFQFTQQQQQQFPAQQQLFSQPQQQQQWISQKPTNMQMQDRPQQAVQQLKKKCAMKSVKGKGKFQQLQEMNQLSNLNRQNNANFGNQQQWSQQQQQQQQVEYQQPMLAPLKNVQEELNPFDYYDFSQCLPTETRIEKIGERDKTKMITYKVPHNSAVQLYDYKSNKQRVVFGPDLVMLEPYESFTLLVLSGGKPKKEGMVKTLAMSLGPDFMTDIVIVETSDHARLSLQLSFNWHFDIDKESVEDRQKIFNVKDFVGDACKLMASRVRGAVSSKTFEEFHHHSSEIIKEAVFGKREKLLFSANSLCITSVDIQNIEITDKKTRQMLAKSINLAIEISSRSQEATSKHEAELEDQKAKGTLDQQKLAAAANSEQAKITLLELEATSKSVQLKGEATAEAQAKAESAFIAEQAKVKQAELRTQALDIEAQEEIDEIKAKNQAEITNKAGQNQLEVKNVQDFAEIETQKFTQLVKAIGKETIIAISKAGPEMKAKLLKGLGLKGYLVSDGKNPINLFNTANGFLGEGK